MILTVFILFQFISPKGTMPSGQELAPSPFWEGCQWVNEPVSRHFFINQTLNMMKVDLISFR
jgi:hypothetical protein